MTSQGWTREDEDDAAAQLCARERTTLSVVIVAAHPDDEAIGAAARMPFLARCAVVHVTNGAPRDASLWPLEARGMTRAEYARQRADEARHALALAGVSRVHALELEDQEAAYAMAQVARRLRALFAELAASVVLVQPYEGGHPDHDATAFATHAAVELLRKEGAYVPRLLEMTSYHAERGRFAAGRFLERAGAHATTVVLTRKERERKRAVLDAYATQREVLARFAVETESFRAAPSYDFGAPPHEGPLYYESLGWPMTSAELSSLAIAAARELDVTFDGREAPA